MNPKEVADALYDFFIGDSYQWGGPEVVEVKHQENILEVELADGMKFKVVVEEVE